MNRIALASSRPTFVTGVLGAAALLAVGCANGDSGEVGSLEAAVKAGPAITVTVAATGRNPVDTAPSDNGNTFYFIGSDGRGPGVFRVSSRGNGNPVHDVRNGAPFVAPQNLVAASDGKRLYVADPGAGSIFAIGAKNGKLEDTLATGNQPRGVEVATTCDDDESLYYTGVDARSGKPALFRVDERGRSNIVYQGAPLSSPGAVAISHDGIAYVSDTPGVPGAGRVIAIDHGAASVLAQGLNLGDPAGVALTVDDGTLLVSGLDAHGHAQVYLIDTGTGAIATFAGGGIGNSTAPGGLHRAADKNVFGWIDRSGRGTIYNIGVSSRAYNAEP